MSRLDRAAFIRAIAHRGLHDATHGIVENTAPAFEAAMARGCGIECDLRPASGGWPIVFHDETLDRLVDGAGPVAALTPGDLARLRYRGAPATSLMSFADLLDLVGGRVPLLVELKSEWTPPDADFLGLVTSLASGYRGPLALMSFDPAVMAACAALAPKIPRGIVSGLYRRGDAVPEARLDTRAGGTIASRPNARSGCHTCSRVLTRSQISSPITWPRCRRRSRAMCARCRVCRCSRGPCAATPIGRRRTPGPTPRSSRASRAEPGT